MNLDQAEEEWQEIVDLMNLYNLSTPHCQTVLEDEKTGTWVDIDCYHTIWLYIPEELNESYVETLGSNLYDSIHDGEMVNIVSIGRKVLLEIFSFDVKKMRDFIQQNLSKFVDAFKDSERDSLINSSSVYLSPVQIEAYLDEPRITDFISNYMTKGLYFINFVNTTLSSDTRYKIVHYGFSKDMKDEYLAFKVREFSSL